MLKLGLNFNTPPFIQHCAHLRIIFDVFLFTRGACSALAMQRQTHGNIGVSWSKILFYTLHTKIFSSASKGGNIFRFISWNAPARNLGWLVGNRLDKVKACVDEKIFRVEYIDVKMIRSFRSFQILAVHKTT